MSHESLTAILEMLELGVTPEEAVVDMIRNAMTIADGAIPDDLLAKVAAAADRAEKHGCDDPELLAALLPSRLTPLDTSRPARDLLEDLLTGIHGCFLLYDEEQPPGGPDEIDPEVEPTTEQLQAELCRHREIFIGAVRAQRSSAQDR